jgi:hypothetical protein
MSPNSDCFHVDSDVAERTTSVSPRKKNHPRASRDPHPFETPPPSTPTHRERSPRTSSRNPLRRVLTLPSARAIARTPRLSRVSLASPARPRFGAPSRAFCFTHLRVIGDPDRRDVAFRLGPLVRGHVLQSLDHCVFPSVVRRRQSVGRVRESSFVRFIQIHPSIHPSRSSRGNPNPNPSIRVVECDADADADAARRSGLALTHRWSTPRVPHRRRNTPRWARTLGSFCSRATARFSPT